MSAPSARRPAAKDEGGPSGPLAIVLSCPKCGAPFTVDDTVVTATCAHCDSLLVLSAPGRDEVYVADGVVRGGEDIREIAIMYRVQAQRAEIIASYSHGQDDRPPPDFWVQARLAAFEQRVRATVQVLDAHRIEVPYWHLTGQIVQATLGRRGDGPKVVRMRAWEVEHTVPGYDTSRADLRDRGLRLSRSRVHPLTAKDLAGKGPFLPWVSVPEQSYREIDKWKGRDLEPGVDAVTRQAGYVHAHRLLVYRPYWLARIAIEGEVAWCLVDGTFSSIAGHPDEGEVQALLRQAVADPLRSTGESYRRVSVAASRCPDCGYEVRLDPAAHAAICGNCHLALEPHPDGIHLLSYAHARVGEVRLDGDYLPFWRYAFRVEVAGAPAVTTLEDYARLLFPQPPPGFAPRGGHLWVPAFRLLGTEFGDEAFGALVQWIHLTPPVVEDGKIPLGGDCRAWPVTLDERGAREVAAFVLFAMHGKASAARLNTMLVGRTIQKAKLMLSDPRLVAVPFTRGADEVLHPVGTVVRVASLLLRGGPELEAQRMTVHAAQRRLQG